MAISKETIIDAIDCALATRVIPTHGPFHTALRAQEQIGWLAMLWGYWATEWQQAYERTRSVAIKEETADRKK
jgi:hypothetical protein